MKKLPLAILLLSALTLLSGCIVYSYRKMPDGTAERNHVRLEELGGEYKSDLNAIGPDYAQYFPALANRLGIVDETVSKKGRTTYRTQYVRIVPENGNLRLQALDKDRVLVAECVLVNGSDFKKVSGGVALHKSKASDKTDPAKLAGAPTGKGRDKDLTLCLTNNNDLLLRESTSHMGFFILIPMATKDKTFTIYPRVTPEPDKK